MVTASVGLGAGITVDGGFASGKSSESEYGTKYDLNIDLGLAIIGKVGFDINIGWN